MPLLQGLPPIARADACVLILGSMPGAASLLAGQYYAHRQNRFWPYMATLIDADLALPYPQRVQRLQDAGIAVWDVIAHCRREGSLDSAIHDEAVNDFGEFLGRHANIATVLFNGAKAETTFVRRVLPRLGTRQLHCRRLPSTSPANASQSEATKFGAWREALLMAGARLAVRQVDELRTVPAGLQASQHPLAGDTAAAQHPSRPAATLGASSRGSSVT